MLFSQAVHNAVLQPESLSNLWPALQEPHQVEVGGVRYVWMGEKQTKEVLESV